MKFVYYIVTIRLRFLLVVEKACLQRSSYLLHCKPSHAKASKQKQMLKLS